MLAKENEMDTMTQAQKLQPPTKPTDGILNPNFKYTPAANTDVQAVWRKFGWTPASESKQGKEVK
tara:strand:+ start:96 stop:290 length:195 start_codon:yes stop_codon:yes gene_type:complete